MKVLCRFGYGCDVTCLKNISLKYLPVAVSSAIISKYLQTYSISVYRNSSQSFLIVRKIEVLCGLHASRMRERPRIRFQGLSKQDSISWLVKSSFSGTKTSFSCLRVAGTPCVDIT